MYSPLLLEPAVFTRFFLGILSMDCVCEHHVSLDTFLSSIQAVEFTL